MWNPSDTLITNKVFKKDKNIEFNITKEEDGIINNSHGRRHHKTIIWSYIIEDQQIKQIGEVTITIHGIKGNKIMQQPTIND